MPDDSTTVQVDNKDPNPAPAYTPPDIKMAEALPPEFRDKPFFKDKGFVDVIKEHVNLQELLGKRPAGIPAEDASDEDWSKFLGTLGPKSTDEYQFPETDFSKAQKRSPEYEKAVKDIMAEAGIPKRSFPKVVQGIESFLAKAGGDQAVASKAKAEAQAAAQAAEFEGLLDKTFGKDKAVVLERSKKMMIEMLPDGAKEAFGKVLPTLSNDVLFALTTVLEGVHKKYIAEDDAPGGEGNAGGDSASLQAEAENIMRSKAYSDFRDPGHDAAKARVQELFGRIAGMRK